MKSESVGIQRIQISLLIDAIHLYSTNSRYPPTISMCIYMTLAL